MFNFFYTDLTKPIDRFFVSLYNKVNKRGDTMKLGEIVKQYRNDNDLSQRQFAKICGISNGYISMLEEGKNPKTGEPIVPSLAMYKKLAAAMGVTVNELMSSAEDQEISIETSALSEGDVALLKALDQLTDDEQKQVIEFAQFLISKRRTK